MNVERVNDPLWMHKPPPEKSELQVRTDEAQDKSAAAVTAMWEEIGKCTFAFELTRREMGPKDKWYADSVMAKGLNAHLLAHSAVLAPRAALAALLDKRRTDAYAEAVRRHVALLAPHGKPGVVLHLGSAMGLLPLLSAEAGANRVYTCEPHGFLAQLAMAQLQRHALLCFERDNWSRMPMSLTLAERCRQAGGAAFRCGLLGKAAALYTEALHAARALRGGEALLGNLLCNRALCHLKLRAAEAALADATEALKAAPALSKAHYRAAQALQALGRMAEARAAVAQVLAHARGGKNADAEKLTEELAGKPERPAAAAGGGGGEAARAAAAVAAAAEQGRSARLTAEQVREALMSRCDTSKVVHCAFDKLRLHHEIGQQIDLVVCHAFDHTLLGSGIISAINALKRDEAPP